MKSFRSQNYYEVLGVNRTASNEEIRSAFELSRHTYQENSLATYSLFTDEENKEILTLISRAYETLFHPELRREYDAFLDGGDGKGSAPRSIRVQPGRRATQPKVNLGGNPRTPPQQPALPLSDPPVPAQQEPPALTPPSANPRRNDEVASKFIESVEIFNGASIRKVRQLRGLSVEDVADRTKIRRAYIEYIEEEQFTFLPAPVYVKGFVTMIAGMLELSPQKVAEDYMHYYHQGHAAEGSSGTT